MFVASWLNWPALAYFVASLFRGVAKLILCFVGVASCLVFRGSLFHYPMQLNVASYPWLNPWVEYPLAK
jgi:hypothetical protein